MAEPSNAQNAGKLPKITCFGDSITDYSFNPVTYGFGAALTDRFRGKAEVLDRGYPGYSSEMLKPEFDELMHYIRNDPLSPLLITILVGSNDACFSAPTVYVPLDKFELNIRQWVDTILRSPATNDTRILLLSTPPINCPSPTQNSFTYEDGPPKERVGFRTYMNKKSYAAKVMEIARSYQDKTDRVAGLNVWKLMVNDALQREGRAAPASENDEYDEDTLPGCSLANAKGFPEGFFTDGLHLGKLGYSVVNKGLFELLARTWPSLAVGGDSAE